MGIIMARKKKKNKRRPKFVPEWGWIKLCRFNCIKLIEFESEQKMIPDFEQS